MIKNILQQKEIRFAKKIIFFDEIFGQRGVREAESINENAKVRVEEVKVRVNYEKKEGFLHENAKVRVRSDGKKIKKVFFALKSERNHLYKKGLTRSESLGELYENVRSERNFKKEGNSQSTMKKRGKKLKRCKKESILNELN